MDYELGQLIDLSKFQNLFDLIYETTGIPSGLIDPNGNILTKAGWRDICTKFHRVNPKTRARCVDSDKSIFELFNEDKELTFRKCQNGLIDIGIPIIIKGKPLATLFQGQFFIEEPDLDFFANQGRQFGFDEVEYLKALKEIPIISQEKIKSIMSLLSHFASIMAEMGLKQLELIETNKRLLEQNEMIKENEKLKIDFFTNISHELRTPVNVIYSAIQVVNSNLGEGDNQKKTLKRYSHIIKQNCCRLIRLTNNLIDVTRIDANFIGLNPSECNIVEVVEDIVLSVAEFTKSKDIELIFDTEIEEKNIFCDVDKIERILLNLISNSIKFINGRGTINVNIFDREEYILISVKDTGIGIPREKHEAIFKRFIRGDELLARSTEGSGIGLSLCKAFVEMHGGEITLESEPGKGSEFRFTIPLDIKGKYNLNINKIEKQSRTNNIEKIAIEFSDIYKMHV